MVKLNRIYTRTGDDGHTGLVGGTRIEKTAPRVCAYGDVDELNAHIAKASFLADKSGRPRLSNKLITIENELFDLGAELATPPGSEWPNMTRVTEELVQRLERWIDELNASLSELRSFVLPGGSELNCELHVARAVCRRAERSILVLHAEEPVSLEVLQYVNRLSDLLFVMSRFDIAEAGGKELLWVPGGSRLEG